MFDLKNLGGSFELSVPAAMFPLPYHPYETLIYTQVCPHLDLSQPESAAIRLWGDLTLKGG